MVTSRAVVGSSAMSSLGSHESAIAIITRWRMPPDISCGYCLTRRSGYGDADLAQHLDRAIRSACPLGQLHGGSMTASEIWSPIVNTGLRLLIGSWKIIAMSLPRMLAHLLLGERHEVAALEEHSRRWRSRPAGCRAGA